MTWFPLADAAALWELVTYTTGRETVHSCNKYIAVVKLLQPCEVPCGKRFAILICFSRQFSRIHASIKQTVASRFYRSN